MATTATTTRPRKATKPKAPSTCRLILEIGEAAYRVRPIPAPAFGQRKAFRLRKAGGAVYHVADTLHGPTCDCGDQTFRHEGRASACKHIRALKAVGLIGA